MTTGEIERVSVPVDGGQADGPSYTPSISRDGNLVAFRSLADNLVQDDRNVASDIFVHDRRTGVTRRVSVNLDLDEGNEDSFAPAISGDGRYVAFESTASNLVAGDTNGVADIFVTDLVTGLTDRVSVASDGRQADLEPYGPSISDDGRFVAFVSASQSLDDRDRDVDLDVYVYDRTRDELSLVSRDLSGVGGNDDSLHPVISGDGSTIAFASAASNLFPGDVNGQIDLFVSDRAGGPGAADHPGRWPEAGDRASARMVPRCCSFRTRATWWPVMSMSVPTCSFSTGNLGSLRLLGQPAGEQTSHFTLFGVLSGDASAVAFASDGSELIDVDDNRRRDIFVQQLTGVHRVEVTGIEEIVGFGLRQPLFPVFDPGLKNSTMPTATASGTLIPNRPILIEPGLNGWTIRLVDERTGETWETVTASVDLDADGSIDPITETGIYQFGPLEPGDYQLYELTQSGWIPTSPAPCALCPIFQEPIDKEGRPPFAGPDPRIAQIPTPRDPAPAILRVTRVSAVGPDEREQLPVLYLHGMYEDGTSWEMTASTSGRSPTSPRVDRWSRVRREWKPMRFNSRLTRIASHSPPANRASRCCDLWTNCDSNRRSR